MCTHLGTIQNDTKNTNKKHMQHGLSSAVINLKTSKNTYQIISSTSFMDTKNIQTLASGKGQTDKPSPQPENNASVYIDVVSRVFSFFGFCQHSCQNCQMFLGMNNYEHGHACLTFKII